MMKNSPFRGMLKSKRIQEEKNKEESLVHISNSEKCLGKLEKKLIFSNEESSSSPDEYIQVTSTQKTTARRRSKTSAGCVLDWARKRARRRTKSSNCNCDGGSSFSNIGARFLSPLARATSASAPPKLFALPLSEVCSDGKLPTSISAMLDILLLKAPYTQGIFRISPNARITRQIKQKLDEGIEVNLEDESIHIIASLLKDFLRNIPESILDCTIYQKWMSVIHNPDDSVKLECVRSMLSSLDACNRTLIRRLVIVFNRIASQSDINNMTSKNLALCIAPNLLWPPKLSHQMDNQDWMTEVPHLLQYFIENCGKIFDGIAPTDDDWPAKVDANLQDRENLEAENEKATVPEGDSSVPDDVMDDRDIPEAADFTESDVENAGSPFTRTRTIRRPFKRRKNKSKPDTAHLICISQDSLDGAGLLIDATRTPLLCSTKTVSHASDADKCLNFKNRRKRCVSNDSGLRNIIGENEDFPSLAGKSKKLQHGISEKGLPLNDEGTTTSFERPGSEQVLLVQELSSYDTELNDKSTTDERHTSSYKDQSFAKEYFLEFGLQSLHENARDWLSHEDISNDWDPHARQDHNCGTKGDAATSHATKTAPRRCNFNFNATFSQEAIDEYFTPEGDDISTAEILESIQNPAELRQMWPYQHQRNNGVCIVSFKHNTILERKKKPSRRQVYV